MSCDLHISSGKRNLFHEPEFCSVCTKTLCGETAPVPHVHIKDTHRTGILHALESTTPSFQVPWNPKTRSYNSRSRYKMLQLATKSPSTQLLGFGIYPFQEKIRHNLEVLHVTYLFVRNVGGWVVASVISSSQHILRVHLDASRRGRHRAGKIHRQAGEQ